ncbi:unnamed protein product [Adineta ricciae]|uniref:Uncharacterized protein n=1 Tax=Adineta ricciae TaxID=249248 RepID=A0A815S868_ADIRI|nr:unnamed protein product [Adineta ricciae]
MNRDSVLYVCTHRGSGVDINKLHQEMTLHVTAAGKTPNQASYKTTASKYSICSISNSIVELKELILNSMKIGSHSGWPNSKFGKDVK